MSPVVQKKKEKFHLPARYALLLVSLGCILLMVLTYTTDLFTGPLNVVANYVIVPFQDGVSGAGAFLVSKAEMMGQIKNLQQENTDLKEQLDSLLMENTSLQQEKYELARLRQLYDLDEQYSQYEKTGARIIAKDSGNWYHSFVINKGANDGITVDMNVIADGGLVGSIIDVGPDWAKVSSIINDNNNVSGSILSTSDNLIVSGSLKRYAEGVIEFSKLSDKGDQVTVGDKVVTSNISEKYLPGILIGYVSEISKDSNNLTKSGLITPAVDFEHLDTVLVILETKQTVSD